LNEEMAETLDGQCPLVANSGLFHTLEMGSALPPKADIIDITQKSPLMTQSGHYHYFPTNSHYQRRDAIFEKINSIL
jgi:hypothetical protein